MGFQRAVRDTATSPHAPRRTAVSLRCNRGKSFSLPLNLNSTLARNLGFSPLIREIHRVL